MSASTVSTAAPFEQRAFTRWVPRDRPTAVILLLRGEVIEVRVEQFGREQSARHRVGRRREMQRREGVLPGVVLRFEGEEPRGRDRIREVLGRLHGASTIGNVVQEAVDSGKLRTVSRFGLAESLPAERIGAIEPRMADVHRMQEPGQHRRRIERIGDPRMRLPVLGARVANDVREDRGYAASLS